MASTNQINSHQSPVFDKSTYNDDHCLLFKLPLEIREEIYIYITQSRVFRGPVSVVPVAFLSPIGGSTEQPAVLTTTTGLSCTCTRTRREFSKALRANATRIMVHIVDFDFSAFIAFHKSWSYRERRKYPIHDFHDKHVGYRLTGDLYHFQTMRSGWIVFIHWNNSSASHCRVNHHQHTCDDCWLHGSQTQQQNLTSWLDYQQSLENNHERLVIKHCANTSGTTRDVMSRTDLERMRTIMVGQTRGTYEEHIQEDSQDRKRAKIRSKRKVERPSDYCEREEFYEAVTASWNMQGRSYRNPDHLAIDAEDQVVLRQGAEVLRPQHVWKAGSGSSGLRVFRGV
jgi:hypothetical protein